MRNYMYLEEQMAVIDLAIYIVLIFRTINGVDCKLMDKFHPQDLVILQKYIKIKCMFLEVGMDLRH